jgi:hypothetical protein
MSAVDGTMGAVGAPEPIGSVDQWFIDPRSPSRRLRVRWHDGQRLVILSLWHGSECTATFRLATSEAARLISALADGLVELDRAQ